MFSSEGTGPKITLLSICLGNSVGRAARAGCRIYHHWDANAGSGPRDAARDLRDGLYKLNGVSIKRLVGTPDLILRKAVDNRWKHLQFEIVLIEKRRRHVQELRAYLERRWVRHPGFRQMTLEGGPRVQVRVLRGDNSVGLAQIVEEFSDPAAAYGSILLDPTGCSPRGGAIDLDVLGRVLALLPRFTLLLQFPHGFARRVWGWNRNHPERLFKAHHLSDYLGLRPYWVVSEPFGRQRAHMVAGGSYYQMGPWHEGQLHLHKATSARGQELIRRCDALADEQEDVL